MRSLIIIAAISGFSAVLMGALGSHFLSPYMAEGGPDLFRTANLYHLVHSLALLGCALLWPHVSNQARRSLNLLKAAAICFVIGLILFSGLIYYVAVAPGFSLHLLIPVGGLSFMAGWGCLGLAGLFLKKEKR